MRLAKGGVRMKPTVSREGIGLGGDKLRQVFLEPSAERFPDPTGAAKSPALVDQVPWFARSHHPTGL